MGKAFSLGQHRGRRALVPVHLSDIEDRKCAGEHPSIPVIIVFVVGLLGNLDLPPQDDRGGAFSFTHLRASILPLLVRSPDTVAISGGKARGPERQRVYAAIALAG